MKFSCDMTVEQAIDILATYGSDGDPIFRFKVETTARDILEDDRTGDAPASMIRIEFYASIGGRRAGSLRDMVFERMAMKARR